MPFDLQNIPDSWFRKTQLNKLYLFSGAWNETELVLCMIELKVQFRVNKKAGKCRWMCFPSRVFCGATQLLTLNGYEEIKQTLGWFP